MNTAAVPVVIIGAGQAGLSVAYFLKRFGLAAGADFVILDRGERDRKSTRLNSSHWE